MTIEKSKIKWPNPYAYIKCGYAVSVAGSAEAHTVAVYNRYQVCDMLGVSAYDHPLLEEEAKGSLIDNARACFESQAIGLNFEIENEAYKSYATSAAFYGWCLRIQFERDEK